MTKDNDGSNGDAGPEDDDTLTELKAIDRMSRDERAAAATLGDAEARFLVDSYYIAQKNRMRGDSQIRALSALGEPADVLRYFTKQFRTVECQLRGALDRYSMGHPVGIWSRSIVGIGAVLGAGFLAYIDIDQAPTVGHIWRFAGLDPTVKWGKGKKRPWCASLKVLCWHAGESFVKFHNHEDDVYGKLYVERKARELARNAEGKFHAQAVERCKELDRLGKTKSEAYKWYAGHYSAKGVFLGNGGGQPMLPPGHLHERAKRWTVKLFLAHYHEVAYRHRFDKAPPLPYAIAFMPPHSHKIEPPHSTA